MALQQFIYKLFGSMNEQDALSVSMQDEIIRIASTRVNKDLPEQLIVKIRQRKWSYMGLEMIMDTVKSIDASEIENYLSRLD